MISNIWTRKDDGPILVLAPMAGYTDSAFRQLCRENGADIVMTELISADAIAYGKFRIKNQESRIKQICHSALACPPNWRDAKSIEIDSCIRRNDKIIIEGKNYSTAEMLSFSEKERPLVVQLFGKYPEKFALATKWISWELKPDGIDINMGCPARKVVGSDHGAALLKNPDLAVEIVKAVKENTTLPVSVKTRLGWENDDEILKFAPKIIEAGIDAIIVHGRTYKDGFKGEARWENIYKTKFKIQNSKFKNKVAVIGNGDIGSYDEAIARANNGPVKLDGVAIGRAAFGNPTIFQDTRNKIQETNLKKIILNHASLAWKSKGERGIIEMRKHLLAYTKGLPDAKEMRKKLVRVSSVAEIEEMVENIQYPMPNIQKND